MEKVFGGRHGGNGAAVKELRTGLRPLVLLGGDVLDRAVGYVLDGTTPEVVLELDQTRNPRVAELAAIRELPARWMYGMQGVSADEARALGITDPTAQQRFPQDTQAARREWMASDAAQADQVARLGRLLVSVGPAPRTAGQEIPGWLAAVAYDGVPMNRRSGDAPVLDPAALVSVGGAGGLSEDAAERAVLRLTLDVPSDHYWDVGGLGLFLTTDAATALLRRRRDVVIEMLPTLPAEAKTALLARIQSLAVADEFAAEVALLAVDRAKTVRTLAIDVWSTVSSSKQLAVLVPAVAGAPAAVIETAAAAIAAMPGGSEALAGLIADAKGARLATLRRVEERASLTSGATGDDGHSAAGTPPLPPFEPIPDGEVPTDFVGRAESMLADRLAALKENRAKAIADDANSWTITWIDRSIASTREMNRAKLSRLRDTLQGKTGATIEADSRQLLSHGDLAVLGRELTLVQWLRLSLALGKGSRGIGVDVPWRSLQIDDLRAVAEACARVGIPDAVDAVGALGIQYSTVKPAAAWAFYVEHPEHLESALKGIVLGDASRWGVDERRARAFSILEAAPFLDPRVLPIVADVALGTGKTFRRRAQALLARHGDARPLAEQGLRDTRAVVRAASARWLAALGETASNDALIAAAAAERNDTARAALISALEKLGADTSAYLSPEALQKEAARGLKRASSKLDWFPFAAAPTVRWADGSPVAPDVVRWWIFFAHKLNDPDGRGILALYLGRLHSDDAGALGRFVLDAWIAQDTQHPSQEAARAFARSAAPARHQSLQDRLATARQRGQSPHLDWLEEQAAIPLERHLEDVYREHIGLYLATAASDKGLLALTVAMPGADLAHSALSYLKTHKGRRSQAESLVVACGANGEPAALQVVLSVARRFAMASVRESARELVESIAEDRGWTMDQLADRTVPTAGFDDDGILRLDLGRREYTGRLTDRFTIELSNDTGKVVKALPAPGQGDDAEQAAEAKKQLSASRKELTQLLATQTARLYEAMCLQRAWPVDEWTEYVHGHPIMRRLAARLVWAEHGEGGIRAFRPVGDGELIDADDAEFTLRPRTTVTVAHAAIMAPDEVEAWRTHVADYEVQALFPQLEEGAPPAPTADGLSIDEREGWLSDTFAIRGRATTRGYVRDMQGEAWFDAYRKDFPAADLSVVLGITGSYVPEEQSPAAVTTLSFRRSGSADAVRLADVPPVLLAEAYRDYVTIAEAGAFDPGWKKATA
ncbi:DUF4132 domain-containing protein [Microbacterium sp. P07]|uniref:DUF4132 domain-containing protein n=1 Tax=Microbacterium sp. P07 TaxID=3366952 RepID=UPI003745E851